MNVKTWIEQTFYWHKVLKFGLHQLVLKYSCPPPCQDFRGVDTSKRVSSLKNRHITADSVIQKHSDHFVLFHPNMVYFVMKTGCSAVFDKL